MKRDKHSTSADTHLESTSNNSDCSMNILESRAREFSSKNTISQGETASYNNILDISIVLENDILNDFEFIVSDNRFSVDSIDTTRDDSISLTSFNKKCDLTTSAISSDNNVNCLDDIVIRITKILKRQRSISRSNDSMTKNIINLFHVSSMSSSRKKDR